MILQFRTNRDINGNCKYLAIDTGAECYARMPIGWIDKEYPVLKLKDYRHLIERCKANNFKEIDRM